MKTLITAITVGVFTLFGSSGISDARPQNGHCYKAEQNSIYVSGYRHGRPVYTERIFIGYDCHGRAKFTYRSYEAPQRQHVERCLPAPTQHYTYRQQPSYHPRYYRPTASFTYCR